MIDRVGQQLGNYRLLRLLGHGGFAEVYLGEHVYLKTQAAIKVLHTRLANEDLESFVVEARTVASLIHPNIVRVLEFGVEASTPFLVMDYAPNGTLRQLHPRGTILKAASILIYIQQVSAALQYAHERKLIHRDIKPENMLVGHREEILLSDFGIALIAHSSRSQSTHEVAGTVTYMAPEQIQGKPRLASDQYALGIVVYEWLCGTPPFRGGFTEVATQHILVPPGSLRERIPTISIDVELVVMTALAKDPQQRFASVEAFAKAFEQACRSQQSAIEAISPNPPSRSQQPTIDGLSSNSQLRSQEPPTEASSPNPRALASSSAPSQAYATPSPQSEIPYTPAAKVKKTSPPSQGEVITSTSPYKERMPSFNSSPVTKLVPQAKKGPNVGLIVGIIALLAILVGSYFVFARSNLGTTTLSGTDGSTTATTRAPIATVALVTDIGGLNDNGFNHLAYTGYKKAEAQYGFPEKIIQTQSQNDYVKNLTSAAQSADLVIAVGFLMETPLDQVAKQFPNKKFAIVDGCAVPDPNTGACETLANVAPLFFKEQEAGCLVGAIAGQMEVDGKSRIPQLLGHNTIAAVGGLPVPAVTRYIAGYKFCAQKVDPSVTVLVNYSNDFAAPAKCKDVAQSQISQHQADIIFQVAGGCGIGALDAAYQNHVFGIGVDADQGYIHPDVITSALKRVDVAVYDIIKDTEGGNFTNNLPKFDLAHDGIGYAPVSSDVPADAKAQADTFASQITSGSLVPPENIP